MNSPINGNDAAADFSQSTGLRIRTARESLGLSAADLAQRIGVESRTIRSWETDKRQPRPNRLVMLSGVLDVSMAWLLEGREPPATQTVPTELAEARRELDQIALSLEELMQTVNSARERLKKFEPAQ